MPNDIRGGQKDNGLSATAEKPTAATPHQSFMLVVGQAILVVVIAEVAGMGEAQYKICGALIVGLWLAFLVNNAPAVMAALAVKRK